LLSLSEFGAFTPGDHTVGRELWELTWTVLQHGAGRLVGLVGWVGWLGMAGW